MRTFEFFPFTGSLPRAVERAMRLGAIGVSIILGLVPISSNAGPGVSPPGATTQDDIEVFDSVGNLYQDSLIRTHGPNCEGRWT
jgi:hypothetical protein